MEASFVNEYEQFELKHWWFTARRRIITQFIDRYAQPTSETRWLDVGAGTGVLLNAYGRITNKVGLETEAVCVERGQAKGLDLRQTGLSWDFSSLGQFDLVTLCDVIEHVEHDREAINAVHASLKPGGRVLVTVPALMSLWSAHDVVNHHYRRYNRSNLTALFSGGRWQIERVSYFSSLLLPMVYAARRLKRWRRGTDAEAGHDLKFGSADPILRTIFNAEAPLLHIGSFPLGSSLILIAKRLVPSPGMPGEG